MISRTAIFQNILTLYFKFSTGVQYKCCFIGKYLLISSIAVKLQPYALQLYCNRTLQLVFSFEFIPRDMNTSKNVGEMAAHVLFNFQKKLFYLLQ